MWEPCIRLIVMVILGVNFGTIIFAGALRHFLNHHPLIAYLQREAHFFDLAYKKGLAHYRSMMPWSKPGQITIEGSPSYIRTPTVPARIQAFNPQIKLIAVLREPVSRQVCLNAL